MSEVLSSSPDDWGAFCVSQMQCASNGSELIVEEGQVTSLRNVERASLFDGERVAFQDGKARRVLGILCHFADGIENFDEDSYIE
jgi:hypothetical protein